MDKETLKAQLVEWRHYLHAHPEAAFEEVNTAAFVAEKLREMGIEVETGIGKTGVVGTLKVGDGKQVIGLRAGGMMAGEDNFTIHIKGKGGHASAPDVVKDPLVTASEIVLALQTIVARNATPTDTAVVSCTEFLTDGAHNAIPSNVVIKGDTRSLNPQVSKLIEERMESICRHICEMNQSECEFTYTHEFAPTFNWAENVKYAAAAAKAVVGENHVVENCEPLMFSEDFGKFIEKVPGCFIFLGNRREGEEAVPLHNSRFNYNDDILLTGAEYFAELVKQRMPK